ncbi:hypothetical protein HDU78_006798 [Chytriomyces hyalinus]|nr:hypothetical protein HDU78_006798 [Chytriomyces hyalinus]
METLCKEVKDQMRINILDVMFKADDLLYAVMYSKLEKAIWEWLGNFLPIFESMESF